MKRRGLWGGAQRRVVASSSALLLALALAPASGVMPVPAAASSVTQAGMTAEASVTPAKPQLATYAGAPGTTSAPPPPGLRISQTDIAQQPYGVAVSGRYTFVADPANHVVRVLIDNSEVVLAGNGSLASGGDGQDLRQSQLVGPYAVTVGHVQQKGFQIVGFNVYIADTYGQQIRKLAVTVPPVDSATTQLKAVITTLAGTGDFGSAADSPSGSDPLKAQFNSPYGLAWDDTSQILYVADTLNNRIRAIHDPTASPTLTPPDIRTVAGTGTTLPPGPDALNHPRGLATDGRGRLYIADTYNNVVRIYDPGNATHPATLSTFAGNGTPGYGGDGLPATKANLRQPAGVAVDGQGNVYIADTGNHIVREVGTDGVIRTVAGTPGKAGKSGESAPAVLAQLSSPMALAARPNGDLVIADTGNNLVRVLEARLSAGPAHNIHTEAGNGTVSFGGDRQPPAVAQFGGPTAILSQLDRTPLNAAVPAVTGTRYVLDTFNQAIRTYRTADTDADNHTVGDKDPDDLGTLAGRGGFPGLAAAGPQPGADARFADPMGMALDPTGRFLYVADTFNNVVRSVDLASNQVSIVAGKPGISGYSGDTGLATDATLSFPIGLAVDRAGDLFIADSYNGVVREVRSQRIYTVAGTGRLGFSGEGGAATQAGLYFPYGVAVDTAFPPNLIITDSFDHRIRQVDAVSPLDARGNPMDAGAKNTIRTLAGDGTEAFADGPATRPPGAPADAPVSHFDRPWSTTLDHGNLVVSDYLNHRIRAIDLSAGTVTTTAGTGSPGLNNTGPPPIPTPDSGQALSAEINGPRGTSVVGDSGALLLADSFNNRIRWIGLTQAGIQRTEVNFDPTNMSGSSQPQSVSVTSTGSGLLVMGNVDLGIDPNDFYLDPQTNTCAQARLEAGNTCSFDVTFQPRAPGNHQGSVVIPNDAIGGAQMVALNGQATASLVMLSPPAVIIYQPIGGASRPVVVTLTNNGNGVLHIGSIALEKPQKGQSSDFAQSNNCPTAMAAHATCQITITLNQIDVGDTAARTDTLLVRDDAGGNSAGELANGGGTTQMVPLTGSLAQPESTISQQSLVFSQNIGTSSEPQSFMLVNTGQVPLHLGGIHDDGDFSQTNNCPPVLAPGAGCAISVTFIPSTLGERDGYIVVADDSADSPQRIPVTGMATLPLAQLGPDHLNFTQTVGTGSSPQIVMLSNRGDGPLTIAAIAATGDFRADPHCPPVLLPDMSCSINVSFAPQGAGSRNGELIVTDDANSAPGSQQGVRLGGFAYQPIASLSATVLSPGSNLGGSTTQTVTVTNTGNGALTIRAITIGGGAAGDYAQSSNCLRTLQPGASCAIAVSFTPHGYGVRAATLTLYDDAVGGAQSIALRGSGTAPLPVLSSGYLNFGGDGVGRASAPQSIVLFNRGTGPLAIGGITLTGSDYLMGTTCGSSLGAGASCRIIVTFLPQAVGSRSGLVTIVDSTGIQRITLSGVGT